MGDFCEEASKEQGKGSRGDEEEAGEQLALEPIAMVGEDVWEEKKIALQEFS